MNEWQAMETAPRDGTVIALDWGGYVVAGFYSKNDDRYPWVILDPMADSDVNGLVDEPKYGPSRWTSLPLPTP